MIVKDIRPEKEVNPKILLIYAPPKSGKTSIVSKLEDHYIIELEPNGADYISGRIHEISKASEFENLLDEIIELKTKLSKYLIIDTISVLDRWSEIVGTYEYMKKPIGKSFNRVDGKKGGKMLPPTHSEFMSVYTLPEGNGYHYSRNVMMKWLNKINTILQLNKVDYVILLAHIKDKYIISKTGETVETTDIDLTGKLKHLYPANVTGVAYFYTENNKGYLSFKNEYDSKSGTRSKHLSNKIILISEFNPNTLELKTFWENVYI